MSLIEVHLMFLTNKLNISKIYFAKAMAYIALQVNERNNKNARSPVRSPSKSMNRNDLIVIGERENQISRAHVGNYFASHLLVLLFISFYYLFFILRAHIFLFTRSLLINKILKTNTYEVNDLKDSFTSRSPVHFYN
ncbi:hypothetical protein AY606_05920 [Acinetobacter sp. SFB]|nr:hypothetical protein AY606_05920 [Acinetobacter sp. SFB]